MGYANTTTGHRDCVRKSSESRLIRTMNLNGWQAVLWQSEDRTEEEWRGLSKADAEKLCVSSESSSIGGKTRPYLGGASTSSGLASLWAYSCWGTKVSSQMNRDGDTNLYRVARTTIVFDVHTTSGTLEKF